MAISNIDELLMGGSTAQQPMSPEEKALDVPEAVENDDTYEVESNEQVTSDSVPDDEPEEREEAQEQEPETDEYGNSQAPENEVIRERLARQARKHEAEIASLRAQLAEQGASREVQQAAKDFEYDPESSDDWQKQLASFVKQTVNSMTREQEETRTRQQEAKAQAEFEYKFRDGMSKFDDFTDVIQGLNFEISNPMTMATRSMENPAAFLYAAAKRNPQELERISKMRDPYAQMVEMGKLEERMRKNKPATKAPRPLGRTTEDATSKVAESKKTPTGDDLLSKADARRLGTVKARLKANR